MVQSARPVSEFVYEHALPRDQRVVLIADRDGRLLGLMSITNVPEL